MRTTYNKFPEVNVQGYDNHAWQALVVNSFSA